MKMNLFDANTLNLATANVIYQLGKNNTKGSRHIVIVPDKYSFGVEKEIFERLELCGASNIDVVSFTRLAIKTQVGKPLRCLSKEGAVILLRKVIDSVQKNLVHYNNVSHLDGFPKEIYAVIASIRNCGYSVDDLLQSIPQLPPSTARKTKDIATIFAGYLDALQGSFDDTNTRLEHFIANLKDCTWVKDSHIYVVGFPSFTGKQLQIIASLTANAISVNIATNSTNSGKNSSLYPNHTVLSLYDTCKPLGITPTVFESYGIIQEPFASINKGLFAFPEKSTAPNANRVTLFAEEHIYNEASAIACEISKLVRRNGYRFKDIAVVNCVPETSSIVSSIFERFAIPHFVDNSLPLANTLLCKFITAVLDCAMLNFKQSAFLAVLKSPYLKVDIQTVENMENFILKYGLTFNGLSTIFKIDNAECYEPVRAKIAKYVNLFPQKATCNEYTASVKTLLADFLVEDTATLFGDLPSNQFVSFNNQAHDRLVALVDEASTLLGDTPTTLSGFINMLSATIEACKISLIPEYIDSVFVGSAKDNRFTDVKALFVMGCSSDALPSMHKFKAIISAMDNTVLEQAGVRLYPTPMDLIAEDQYYFLELMTAPTDRLYLSYSTTSHSGVQQRMSAVLKEISNITGVKISKLSALFNPLEMVTKDELEDALVTTNNAYFEYLYTLGSAPQTDKNGVINIQSMYMALNKQQHADIKANTQATAPVYEPISELYFSKNEDATFNTRITALEQYYRCPYAHHLQVGLGLKERETASLQNRDIGNILQGIMELYFSRTLGVLDTTPQDTLEEIMDIAIADACALWAKDSHLFSVLNKNMLDNIKRESKIALKTLTQNVLKGNYRPAFIELSFGKDNPDYPPITFEVGGTKYLMRGKIDRVDEHDNRILVIDYKTGSTDSKISKLYTGQKLQLYTYLNVLTDKGYKVGGVFYLPLKDKYTKDKVSYKLTGQILHTNDNLLNISKTVFDDADASGKSTYYCDIVEATIGTTKKNGAVFKQSANAIEEETFTTYATYAYDMAESAIKDIANGCIAKSPYDDACKYCVYKPICGDIDLSQRRCKVSTKAKPYCGTMEMADDEE